MIGTSGEGVICGEPVPESVVVNVLASPHLTVEVGVGEDVAGDWQQAVRDALPTGQAAAYFRGDPKLGRPFYFSHPASGLAPLFVLMFSPGITAQHASRSHEIHAFLKRRTFGRIPIVGGGSGTRDLYAGNAQIANGRAYRDAVVMAVVETDLLFGVGVAHGFRPTRKRAIVTKAEGHILYELDGRPAAEVCAELIGVSLEDLQKEEPILLSRKPFGTADAFGQHHLLVPERVLEGGSVQFAWIIDNLEAITLMEVDPEHRINATRDAVDKAIEIGQVVDPASIMLFSCARRYIVDDEAPEAEREGTLRVSRAAPTTGFLTFGEYALTEEGLPIYCNQSVVALVIGQGLEPFAVETRQRANALKTIETELARKSAELDAMRRANEVVLSADDWREKLVDFEAILRGLTGAESVTFHVGQGAAVPGMRGKAPDGDSTHVVLPLLSVGRTLGHAELSASEALASLEVARSIADHVARNIHRALMEHTIEEQAREIETVRGIAQEILGATNYRQALVNISEQVRRHVGARSYSLWMGDEAAGLRCETLSDAGARRDLPLASRAVEARSVHRETVGGKDYVALPLLVKERINGALVLALPADAHLAGGELGFLIYLSMPLAVMLEIYTRQRESDVAREIHHRIKNNLQIIASLLSLQLSRLSEPEAREALENSIGRIMGIAVVHEALSGKQLDRVDAVALIHTISQSVLRSMRAPQQELTIEVEGAPSLDLSSRLATNLAVVVNELVGNALKHGPRDAQDRRIRVHLLEEDTSVVLTVCDDGGRLPADFDLSASQGLGLQLVQSIAEGEFCGTFSLDSTAEGVEARLVFPRDHLPALEVTA